ncbi:MAG: response regulator [Lachnospiraceae bacterium]|nr:response regulator [Lachnospiraceae bacterium]
MSEKMKILAVDDNSISLATLEHELKKDYEVIPMNSGDRALQYLRREKPNLILMDIQMAQKSGIETLREIRGMEKCKDIPVIMLTSKQDKASVVESSKLGVDDYVVKPFKGDDLQRRIERVLREHK